MKFSLFLLFREIIIVYWKTHNYTLWVKCRVTEENPLKNSKLRRPPRGGGKVLGRQTGLWSTEAKVRGIVPRAAWHWSGDSSVPNDPFGAQGSTPSYVCPSPAWGCALKPTVLFVGGNGNSERL
jgi:hypothetical protein